MRGIKRDQHRADRLRSPGGSPEYAPVTGGQASPPAPMVMPLHEVIIAPVTDQYATVAYRGLTPIWAPSGEAIPARAPGRWAQLRAAGRT